MSKTITKEVIQDAMSYQEYRDLIDQLLAEGKATGTNQSEAMTEYTKMNAQRMQRLDKTVELNEDLKSVLDNLEEKQIWLVLTEGWCGDAAQNVPVFNKIAEASDKIDLKLILRDEYLEVMDDYLTNGGRSIPKLIILDEDLNELATWGPRPKEAQKMVMEHKKNPQEDYQEFVKKVQLWYAKDKSLSLQNEIREILRKL